MGTTRRFTEFSVDGVTAAMRPGVNHQVVNLAGAYGTSPTHTRRLLEQATLQGLVERVQIPHTGTCYRLIADMDPHVDERVKPAYPFIQMEKPLVGYDRELRAQAALSMLVRRQG